MSAWNLSQLRDKLGKTAKSMGLRMPQMQLLLCQERFLARLATLEESKYFVWKGGSLIIRQYQALEVPRYTVDIDLLAKGFQVSEVKAVFQKACNQNLNDSFSFINIEQTQMVRDTPYGGDRFEIDWMLFNKPHSEKLRIDVCTGDDVSPKILTSNELFLFPQEGEKLSLAVYPREFIFAEKLETVIRFGTGNTRLKDIIDLWALIQSGIDMDSLNQAVKRCFACRKSTWSAAQFSVIMSDQTYIQIMEQASIRRYSHLKLPDLNQMILDIKTIVQNIEI